MIDGLVWLKENVEDNQELRDYVDWKDWKRQKEENDNECNFTLTRTRKLQRD